MEQPPALPRPPLGRGFYVTLFTPLVLMVLSFCFVNSSKVAPTLLSFTGLATLVGSVVLAVMLAGRGERSEGARIGIGVVWFIALIGFYGIAFFIGCTAAVAMS